MEKERTDMESGEDGKDGEANQEGNSQSQIRSIATEDNADEIANSDSGSPSICCWWTQDRK